MCGNDQGPLAGSQTATDATASTAGVLLAFARGTRKLYSITVHASRAGAVVKPVYYNGAGIFSRGSMCAGQDSLPLCRHRDPEVQAGQKSCTSPGLLSWQLASLSNDARAESFQLDKQI